MPTKVSLQPPQLRTDSDTDPRVYFAAERTFLAWIRTGLALMGFGFVVARFGLFLREMAAANPSVKSYGFSLWVGTLMVFVGALMNIVAAVRHYRVIDLLNRHELSVGRPSYSALAVALILGLGGFAMVAFLMAVE